MADKIYLSSKDYKLHKENIVKLNAGGMTLSEVQYATPNVPIYRDGVTGKYTNSPTANYPTDIKTWYNTNTANEALAKSMIGQWPYNGNGSLTEAGYKKFKSEVIINKPVAVDKSLYATESRKAASSNVVHDIAQLDSDIRDSRIKATMLIVHRLKMTERMTNVGTSGSETKGRVFKPDVKHGEKLYYNMLNETISLIASITRIGGAERIERQKDPDNERFSTYNRGVPTTVDKHGKDVPAKNLTAADLDSSVPQPGEVVDHGIQTNETEATLEVKLEVAKTLINNMSQEGQAKKILSGSTPFPDGNVNSDTHTNEDGEVKENSEIYTETVMAEAETGASKVQKKSGDEVPALAKDKKFSKWLQHPGGTPRENMLHYFSSFNTQFELFMMNPNDYNGINSRIALDAWSEEYFFDFTDQPERLIVNSAGVRTKMAKKGSSQNRYFNKRDYFIDNVTIESFISPSKKNGGAKFTNLSMQVFEPYGSTFLENLIRACGSWPIARGEEKGSYLDIPYMLKIKFNGYDETGEKLNTRVPMKAEGLPPSMRGETVYSNSDFGTKYLMLKIANFNFKVTAEGTMYEIQMMNYNAFALESYGGTLEANIQVNSNSLGSFFGLHDMDTYDPLMNPTGGISEFTVETEDRDNTRLAEWKDSGTPFGYREKTEATRNDGMVWNEKTKSYDYVEPQGHLYGEGPRNQYAKPKVSVRRSTTHRSFPAILNSIQEAKTKKDDKSGVQHQLYADTYEFKFKEGLFDRSFLDKKIVKPDSMDINHVPVYNNKVKAVSPYVKNWQFSTQEGFETAFQITAGKSILDVCHAIISSSTFMTDQVEARSKLVSPPGSDTVKNGYYETTTEYFWTKDSPILLYKITPLCNIGKWDHKRKTYQKHYTYVIELYDAQGEAETDMGKYAVTDVCKQYDYLYTGTNKDVLEFDLTFDAGAFETNIIGGFTHGLAGLTSAEQTKRASDEKNASAFASAYVSATKNVRQSQNRWMPGSGAHDFQVVKANNLMTRIYNSGADRLAGELTIMGDPDFIVQDEGFNLEAFSSHYSPNGSVSTKKQPIILLNFLTPVDINSSTGTIHNDHDNPEGYQQEAYGKSGFTGNSTSVFSGFYKIMTITSSFEGNQFTQLLNLVRVQSQEYDYPDGAHKAAFGSKALSHKVGEKHLNYVAESATQEEVDAANEKIDRDRKTIQDNKSWYYNSAGQKVMKNKSRTTSGNGNVRWEEGPANQIKRELPITAQQSNKKNVTGVLPPGLKGIAEGPK